ncbi:MAG: tRNA pseudouridine(38-40) synthase TruA [bacterium]
MKYLKITLEYDGGRYSGWQLQPAKPTVQEAVEAKLSQLLNAPVRVHASGRTDAGVHALGQAAHFSTHKEPDLARLMVGFNSIPPRDLSMTGIKEVDATFHARKSALGKWYRYRILNRPFPSPFENGYSWFIHRRLNLESMCRGGGLLTGTHDFSSFKGAGSDTSSQVRTICQIVINRSPVSDIISLDFYGNGFLKYMVRIIVGTLLDVGREKISPDDLKEILAEKDRKAAGVTAPPEGLYLMTVFYEHSVWEKALSAAEKTGRK